MTGTRGEASHDEAQGDEGHRVASQDGAQKGIARSRTKRPCSLAAREGMSGGVSQQATTTICRGGVSQIVGGAVATTCRVANRREEGEGDNVSHRKMRGMGKD